MSNSILRLVGVISITRRYNPHLRAVGPWKLMEGPMSADPPAQPSDASAQPVRRPRAPRAAAALAPEHIRKLSKHLRELRGDAKKAPLARELDVAESTYASWEDGTLAPRLDSLVQLA